MLQRSEIAVLVILTGNESKTQTIHGRHRRWRAAGAAQSTGHVARVKAVPVRAAWLQASDFHVHGVSQLRQCRGTAALHNAAEGIVSGQLPTHIDGAVVRTCLE